MINGKVTGVDLVQILQATVGTQNILELLLKNREILNDFKC